jgi:hypothetical protein
MMTETKPPSTNVVTIDGVTMDCGPQLPSIGVHRQLFYCTRDNVTYVHNGERWYPMPPLVPPSRFTRLLHWIDCHIFRHHDWDTMKLPMCCKWCGYKSKLNSR